MPSPDRNVVSIDMKKSLHKAIKVQAIEEGITMTELVNRALMIYLKNPDQPIT